MRQSQTMTRFVCDGCGAEAPEERAGDWRHLSVQVGPVVLGQRDDHARELDLCGECVTRIVMPGVGE